MMQRLQLCHFLPVIKEFYPRLIKAAKKVALIAGMRTLLPILNPVIKEQKP